MAERLCEHLLFDEETKDVDIEMSDGVLQAHSVVLCASSDAIRGMLKHGVGASCKTLSWREHPVKLGRFFLGLLYTGTVDEEFLVLASEDGAKDGDGQSGAEAKQVPLELLLGSLQIAKVYMICHMLQALTEALKQRLAIDTFDDITSAAVKLDVTVLRLHCLRYAEAAQALGERAQDEEFVVASCGEARAVGSWQRAGFGPDGYPCYRKTSDSKCKIYRNATKRHWTLYFTDREGKQTLYRSKSDDQPVSGSVWKVAHGAQPAPTIIAVRKAASGARDEGRSLRSLYGGGRLSPEVLSELAPLWGRPPAKRRRVALTGPPRSPRRDSSPAAEPAPGPFA